MKVLVDMNLSPRWATELQSRGFDAVHWSQVGSAAAPDEEILAWCAGRGYVLFTHDLDFGAILASAKGHGPSVVQLRSENIVPEAMLEHVTGVLRQREGDISRGVLVTIEPGRSRVRLLPLTPE